MANHKNKTPQKPAKATIKRWGAWGMSMLLLLALGGLAYSVWFNREEGTETVSASGARAITQPRALIADQLGNYHPNPAFVREATALLEAAGYTVTYLPTEAITVDFYRQLPLRGEDLILLRAHGTVAQYNDNDGSIKTRDFVSLASGEQIPEDLNFTDPFQLLAAQEGWLERFTMLDANEDTDASGVFLITQGFFTNAMEGQFNDSVLVLMGCDGLHGTMTAEHFLYDRGARAVVGWDGKVSAQHMDDATLYWLQHYLQNGDNQALINSTLRTQQHFGADPFWKGNLQVMLRDSAQAMP